MKGMLVVLLSLALLVSSVSALKCYVCSETKANCKKNEISCPKGFEKCLKIENTDTKGVAKTCSNAKVCDLATKACKTSDKCKASCCDKDGCNAGSSLKSFVVLTTLAPFVAVYYMM